MSRSTFSLYSSSSQDQPGSSSRSERGDRPALSALQEGDIIVETEEEFKTKGNNYNQKVLNDYSSLGEDAGHGMIYGQESNRGQRVYHSAIGEYQLGVKSHPIQAAFKVIKKNDSESDDEKNSKQADSDEEENKEIQLNPLGSYRVLRFKDPALGMKVAEVARRWDATLMPKDIIQNRPKDKYTGRVLLPTPYVNALDRNRDAKESVHKYELFRAFQAYMRNQNKRPLSNKGWGCGNFIAYSLKAAIIETCFPKGLPKTILQQLNHVEELRQQKGIKSIKQLDAIDPTFLDNFYKLIEEAFPNKEYFDMLIYPIKGYTMKQICRLAQQHPDVFTFEGFVVAVEKESQSTFSVANFDAYDALLEQGYKDMKVPEQATAQYTILSKGLE